MLIKGKMKYLLLLFISASSHACAQDKTENTAESSVEVVPVKQVQSESIHSYGGWYCPDNLTTFPPVNAADFSKIEVISNRLPSLEEARSGKALMYLDPAKYPSAKALNLALPRLAKYYSANTRQEELVIIIQAVVADQDTVVGFRFLDGGNGSSWLHEVELLSDAEATALAPSSYVFFELNINTSKEKVYEAITKTTYAQELSSTFNKKDLFTNPWSKNTQVDLIYKTMEEEAKGYVMNMYGNIYLQIDYVKKGQQSIEKILILDNEDGKSSKIQAVFGPYLDDFKEQEKAWNDWLKEIEKASLAEAK
jgi:hypothetical protein